LARPLLPVVALALALAARLAFAEEPKKADEGFVPLFNGKDLTGWVVMGAKQYKDKDGTMKDDWHAAEDGTLVCEGKCAGWLRSEKQYKNFVLKLEYRISKGGNSGVFVHAPERGQSSHLGREVQILDCAGRPVSKSIVGGYYSVIAPRKNMARPFTEWNDYVMTCNGSRFIVAMNGEETLNADLAEAQIEASCPKGFLPGLKSREGYIGLQDHRSRVEFRNLLLKVLP